MKTLIKKKCCPTSMKGLPVNTEKQWQKGAITTCNPKNSYKKTPPRHGFGTSLPAKGAGQAQNRCPS
jgi:hypothetical protein